MAIIIGTDKEDTLNGTPQDDQIFGKGGSDILRGFGGNDVLDGGEFFDDLYGGTGNDVYYADRFDRVVERGREGTDEVRTGEIYALGPNVENLTLLGSGNVSGTGTSLNNIILGNQGNNALSGLVGNDTLRGMEGNDSLDGGAGNDFMAGGTGADVYYVDRVGDRVFERGREGTDEVRTTLNTYALGPNVENLSFIGTGDFSGTGTSLNNIIQGGQGSNTFRGGAGNDTLRGGLATTDTAIFAGKSTDYSIVTKDGVTIVRDNNAALAGDDGRDTLTGVERLQFSDKTITLTAPAPVVELETLNGATGFRMYGSDQFDRFGWFVAAGDVNDDGFDDMMVSDPSFSTGESVYVVFGKASGWTPIVDLSTLDGTNGFRLDAEEVGDVLGNAISAIGDINSDGVEDLIIGAVNADPNGAQSGTTYVVFGKSTGWDPTFDLSTLNGLNGFQMHGEGEKSFLGRSVASAGDVNGDGIDDIIIGAVDNTSPSLGEPPEVNLDGKAYVVFGKTGGWGAEFDLSSLDGKNGFRIDGEEQTGATAVSVSSAGDVNGDGFDDIFIGAPEANGESAANGGGFVVFGKASGWSPTINLGALDGSNGFEMIGRQIYDFAGHEVRSAGDINGDGFDDMVIASRLSPYSPSGIGAAYVVFGKASGWSADLDLGTLNGSDGFLIVTNESLFGSRVAGAGDVNGDGRDDLVVSKFNTSYVVYGKETGWDATLDLSTLDGTNGFQLVGEGDFDTVRSISSAGDVNGDGFDDLIIGVPNADSSDGQVRGVGASYVVFGGNFTGAVTHLGTVGNDTLNGTGANESFVGGLGNDTFNGNGGVDAFQGGAGNDTARLSGASFFHIDGGHGVDTIALAGSGITLDLTARLPSEIESIERINITGTGNNTLRLSISDVLDISDESNSLLVAGNAGDTVVRGAGWTEASTGGSNGDGTSTIGGQTYQHYNAGQANLLVDTDVGVLVA